MSTLHMPKRFVQLSRSFKGTDPGAWITLAVGLLVLIGFFAAVFG